MSGRAWLWFAAVALLAAALGGLVASHRLTLQTNLLALLPAPQRDPLEAAALHRIAGIGERRLLILVGASDPAKRRQAGRAVARALTANGAFEQVVTRADDWRRGAGQQRNANPYFQHRFHLLAPADVAALRKLAVQAGKPHGAALRHFLNRAQRQLYGIGLGGGGRFIDDPFGLAAAYRNTLAAHTGGTGIRIGTDGQFIAQAKTGNRFAVVLAQTRQDPFTMSAQARQSAGLRAARHAALAAAPGAEFLVSGVLPHALAATGRARYEMTLIGGGSLAGILVLMVWAFGGLRPILLSVAAIAGGCLLALVVTGGIFGSINVLTLVFGASLVGVAIDYCFHFFAQRWRTPAPQAALRHIFPAVTLGLITSVLAYGGMAIAPFPGLRQMAMFAACGLIGAWLGVLLLLPAGAGPPPRSGAPVRLAQAWLTYGPARLATGRGGLLWCCAGLACLLCTGLTYAWLTPRDDIHLLYRAPAGLRHDEQRVAAILGRQDTGRAILVRGDSAAHVLDSEAVIVRALQMRKPPIASLSAITRLYPPPAQQQRNYRLLAASLYAPGGPAQQLLRKLGFSAAQLRQQQADFAAARGHVLSLADWRQTPAGAALDPLWLGKVDGQWGTLIPIHRVNDASRLAAVVAHYPAASNIDRVAAISTLLGHYRREATWLLAGAYVLAWLLLCRPFGARAALLVLVPPLLASVGTALLFAATGWSFSLFNVMAMILLLGMGADYGIFMRMAGRDRAPAMAAVALSAATTLLAFGLLALSRTPALHSFGLTLTLGLTLTFLLASLIGSTSPEHAK